MFLCRKAKSAGRECDAGSSLVRQAVRGGGEDDVQVQGDLFCSVDGSEGRKEVDWWTTCLGRGVKGTENVYPHPLCSKVELSVPII